MMSTDSAEVVICGAGIAGIAAAYFLAVQHRLPGIVLVDERPPLTLTSDKSTEAYRNWWPGPGDAMVRLMNRSIDLLEELAQRDNRRLQLNRRGYAYATADPARAAAWRDEAAAIAALGAGPLRIHAGSAARAPYRPAAAAGFAGQPDGADLLLDRDLIQRHFTYLAPETVAVLHARRCGWFSGQQLGMLLLEEAQVHGVRLVQGRVAAVALRRDRVSAIRVQRDGAAREIATAHFVNAAGPYVDRVAALLGLTLPVRHELHLKFYLADRLGIVPRDAPLLIWADPQRLAWSEEERHFLAQAADTRWLLDELPAGAHLRPEGHGGSPMVILLWDYHTGIHRARPHDPVTPRHPPPLDPGFPEIALRGLSRAVPGLAAYVSRLPPPNMDGGYYTRTPENRLLACPLPVPGAYVIGALSGYGLMASLAAGELLAAHVVGASLPAYAPAFDLRRYDDPAYQARLADWPDTGQL